MGGGRSPQRVVPSLLQSMRVSWAYVCSCSIVRWSPAASASATESPISATRNSKPSGSSIRARCSSPVDRPDRLDGGSRRARQCGRVPGAFRGRIRTRSRDHRLQRVRRHRGEDLEGGVPLRARRSAPRWPRAARVSTARRESAAASRFPRGSARPSGRICAYLYAVQRRVAEVPALDLCRLKRLAIAVGR